MSDNLEIKDQNLSIPIFAGFKPEELRFLLHGAQIKKHQPGAALFKEGELANFFGYVLSGAYKLSQLNFEGEEIIMHIGVRGEALAIMATMSGNSRFPFDSIAMGPSTFLAIPARNFKERWIFNPTLMFRYQSDLQGRIFRSHDEKRLQTHPLAQRIADLIIYLSRHKKNCIENKGVPITRREIAAYVGASVESVIRVMSVWQREGIIKSYDRCIEVIDQPKLMTILAGKMRETDIFDTKPDDRLASLWQTTSISTSVDQ